MTALTSVVYPCGVSAVGTGPLPSTCPEHSSEIACVKQLVKESCEIMEIVYAANFPAGIESYLTRAHRFTDNASTPNSSHASLIEELTRIRQQRDELREATRLVLGMVRSSASSYTSHPDFLRAQAAVANAEARHA